MRGNRDPPAGRRLSVSCIFPPQSALHLPQRTAEKDGAGDPWLPRGPSAPTSLSRAEDISAEIAAYRRLSERERQVLRLVSQELTSQAAAERLGISKRMVDHQRTDALKKLSVRSPAELAGFFDRVEHHLANSAGHVDK